LALGSGYGLLIILKLGLTGVAQFMTGTMNIPGAYGHSCIGIDIAMGAAVKYWMTTGAL
jgi:hypothetical protein